MKTLNKIDRLQEISKIIVNAMDETFENDECISCKEIALLCLEAACPAQYRPVKYVQAIELLKSIGATIGE
jgi:hypothetical protein